MYMFLIIYHAKKIFTGTFSEVKLVEKQQKNNVKMDYGIYIYLLRVERKVSRFHVLQSPIPLQHVLVDCGIYKVNLGSIR